MHVRVWVSVCLPPTIWLTGPCHVWLKPGHSRNIELEEQPAKVRVSNEEQQQAQERRNAKQMKLNEEKENKRKRVEAKGDVKRNKGAEDEESRLQGTNTLRNTLLCGDLMTLTGCLFLLPGLQIERCQSPLPVRHFLRSSSSMPPPPPPTRPYRSKLIEENASAASTNPQSSARKSALATLIDPHTEAMRRFADHQKEWLRKPGELSQGLCQIKANGREKGGQS